VPRLCFAFNVKHGSVQVFDPVFFLFPIIFSPPTFQSTDPFFSLLHPFCPVFCAATPRFCPPLFSLDKDKYFSPPPYDSLVGSPQRQNFFSFFAFPTGLLRPEAPSFFPLIAPHHHFRNETSKCPPFLSPPFEVPV